MNLIIFFHSVLLGLHIRKCVVGILFSIALTSCVSSENNDTQGDNANIYEEVSSFESSNPVQQWKQVLSGTRLNYYHTYRSYSGGFTRVQLMDLCPQGFYNFYRSTSFDVVGNPVESGTWQLREASGNVILVLTPEGGIPTDFRLGIDQKRNITLNGKSYIPEKKGKYGPRCY